MKPHAPPMAWIARPPHSQWIEKLRDGTEVLIRPITKDDADKEGAFIESLSPQSRRYRFLGQIGEPSRQLLSQLTDIDYSHDAAFAACVADDPEGRFIGVGQFNTSAGGVRCECAVAVLDEWQHRGVGTVLMKSLIQIARARCISYMYSVDVAENSAMADLASYLGFSRRPDREDATLVLHTLWLNPEGTPAVSR